MTKYYLKEEESVGHALINRKTVKENRFMKGNQWEDCWNHRRIKSTITEGKIPGAKIGKVVRLRNCTELVDCIGQTDKTERILPVQDQNVEAEQLLQEIRTQGIHGMGGAAFDTAEKIECVLQADAEQRILLVNGVSCDPGLLHDRWLLHHHMQEIEMGVALLCNAFGFDRVILAVKEPYEVETASTEVRVVPDRYPMGAEKILLECIPGISCDAKAVPAKQCVLVLNVQTIYAIYQAHYQPEMQHIKYITVADLHTGIAAIARIQVGQPVYEIAEKTFGDQIGQEDVLYYGGGILLADEADRNSVTDDRTGFIGFGQAVHYADDVRCKGCKMCVRRFPVGIDVYKAVRAQEKGKKPPVTKEQAALCLQCGICSYYCRAAKDTMKIIQSLK